MSARVYFMKRVKYCKYQRALLYISILIHNFKTHNIIMSDRVYFMKRVKDCKDVSIMSPQDEQ